MSVLPTNFSTNISVLQYLRKFSEMADYASYGNSVHLRATMCIFCIQISASNTYLNWLFIQEWYLSYPTCLNLQQPLEPLHFDFSLKIIGFSILNDLIKCHQVSLVLFSKILQFFRIFFHFYSLVKLYLNWLGHWRQVEQDN